MTTQYNIVSYGTLTNTDGVLSNFSTSNYATLPKKFAPSGDSFEIVIKFKLDTIDTSQDTYPTLLASSNTSTDWDGYNFQIYEGALYFELVQNSEAVVIVHDNTKVLSANVDYYAKAIFDGSAYTTYISTNGTTWTQQASVTSSIYYQPTNINTTYLGRQNYTDITNVLDGSIDLNESYIDINNIRWWQGVTSVSNVQTRIQLRHDTSANWTSVNPILLVGEVGIETDTLKQKIGDGSTAWNSLPYQNEIFIAEYNVTSWNDIVSAYNSGKTIICKYLPESSSSDIFNYPQYSLDCFMNVRKNTGNLVSIKFYFEFCSISVNSTNWSKSSDNILREAAQNNTEYIYPASQYFGVLSTDDYTTVYNLIDTTTGLIPDARISSNIARTSAIPDISTKQDTLVSGTNIKTVNNTSLLGSGNIDTSEIFVATYGTTTYADVLAAYNAGKQILCKDSSNIIANLIFYNAGNSFTFTTGVSNNNAVEFNVLANNTWTNKYYYLADTDLSNLSSAGKEVLDGQWTASGQDIIASAVSLNGSSDLPYTVTLPNDGHIYEVMLRADANTTATSGNWFIVGVKTNSTITGDYVFICGAKTTANNSVGSQGTVIVPIKYGTDNLYLRRNTNYHGSTMLKAIAYRRVGTNS